LQHEGFVFSVINGFMNASNAFYMVCEPMYNAGLSLKTQFMIFAAIPLVIGILAVLFYPPLEVCVPQDLVSRGFCV
jgi:hypothetical protein